MFKTDDPVFAAPWPFEFLKTVTLISAATAAAAAAAVASAAPP
jgi:hypothetical protein